MTQSQSFLIVGAGAMGVACAHHLAAGGHRITFLVRPGRATALPASFKLYSYDDHRLHTLSGYAAVDHVDTKGPAVDWVLLTLDGHALRSDQGIATLRQLGDAYRESSTRLLIGSVGVDLVQHALTHTGLPRERVISGCLTLLCHPKRAELPLHPPTDAALLAQADFAFRHFQGRYGFMLESQPRAASLSFAGAWAGSASSLCARIPPQLLVVITSSGFSVFMAAAIAGWPPVDELIANTALWRLVTESTREIAGLPDHGWAGWMMSRFFTSRLQAAAQRMMVRNSMPLDYQAFNRFHHGGKVLAQDVVVLEHNLAVGRQQGREMPALAALLDAYRFHNQRDGAIKAPVASSDDVTPRGS